MVLGDDSWVMGVWSLGKEGMEEASPGREAGSHSLLCMVPLCDHSTNYTPILFVVIWDL